MLVASQSVYQAVIVDKDSKKAIDNANILIVNSSEGFYSNREGKISIPITLASGADLIITHVNYEIESKYIGLEFEGVDTIKLTPKVHDLDDVTIKSKKSGLKDKRLKIFRKDLFDFLYGKKNMYKKVDFLNPEDVLFFLEDDQLKAESKELLQFKNNHLGYEIKCLLETYTRSEFDLTFEGKAIYQESETSKRQSKRFQKRREEVWKTSQQNFFRQLIHNELDTKSFNCKALIPNRYEEGYLPVIDFTGFVYPTKINDVFAILSPAPITVESYGRLSHIMPNEGIILINKNGLILNKDEVLILGDWSQQSLTKTLPTNYKPQSARKSPFNIGPKRSISELRSLAKRMKSDSDLSLPIDEVIIETDKTLYQWYDRIYICAHVFDHKTKVPIDNCLIKIELVDEDGVILFSKTKEVENGIAQTSFLLNDSIASSQYGIRAYTNHMQNFSENLYGKTTIAIDQLPTNVQMKTQDTVRIKFASEGGKTLYDLENRVVAYVTDTKGRPISFSGILLDNFTREQFSINTIIPGLAVFNVFTLKESNYILSSKDGNPISSNMSHLFPKSGTNLHVFCRNKKRYKISILSNKDISMSEFRILDRSMVIYKSDSRLLSTFSISKDYLPNQILSFQLIGENSEIISERIVDNRRSVEPVISFKKQYEFFYNNQVGEIEIEPNLNSDFFVDSLHWSVRIVNEDYEQNKSIDHNLERDFITSSKLKKLSITNQNYIRNLELIGSSFISQYKLAYEKNINDLEFKQDFEMSISGVLNNPDVPNQSENGRLNITSMSDILYSAEVSTNDEGKFQFNNLPFEPNLNFIIQARSGVNEEDEILDGSRYIEISIDSLNQGPQISKTQFIFRQDLMPNDSLITYKREFFKSLEEGIQLEEVTIKDRVSNSIGTGDVKDLAKMDWISKHASGQNLMQQLYPGKIIRRSIKDPGQMEILINSRKDGFVYQTLIITLNGTLEYSAAMFEFLTADRIKFINLSKNFLSIVTNPGMQSRTEIREQSLGIKTYIIPETIDDTSIDKINDIASRNFAEKDNRQLLYWKPNTQVTRYKNTPIVFRTSDNTGTYTLIASAVHPLLGYISYSLSFEVAENKK
jgi:hypothetical protein